MLLVCSKTHKYGQNWCLRPEFFYNKEEISGFILSTFLDQLHRKNTQT